MAKSSAAVISAYVERRYLAVVARRARLIPLAARALARLLVVVQIGPERRSVVIALFG